ncbi:MAG TPA: sigma-70 family RNA polymerase sigma factor [Planctomycetes bacterium]|nr:sigma-70 family RNA polymerase sigma factor [Planctomycetota bacterium]
MSQAESGTKLFDRWRDGDEEAARALFARYAERLGRLVERQLDDRLRRRIDPDDVVQSVFRSFFRRTAAGAYQIDHSGALWRLLVRITLSKVRRQAEHHRAAKRDVAAEVHWQGCAADAEAMAKGPTPEEALTVVDELGSLLRRFHPREAHIVALSLRGYSRQEVADQVGCSRWTVRRVLDRAGHSLQKRLETEDL